MVIQVGEQEVLINPSSHYWYIGESEGIYDGTYIDVEIKEPEKKARTIWEVQTCVTAIKQFLGIRKYGIFTPYQLYRYLNEQPIQKAKSS